MNPSNRLRELRKKAGLSQAAMAELSGVSQPTISQMENDVLGIDTRWLRTFARILNCAPADILPDQDNPDRLSEEERALIAAYRAASPDARAVISRLAGPPPEEEAASEAA